MLFVNLVVVIVMDPIHLIHGHLLEEMLVLVLSIVYFIKFVLLLIQVCPFILLNTLHYFLLLLFNLVSGLLIHFKDSHAVTLNLTLLIHFPFYECSTVFFLLQLNSIFVSIQVFLVLFLLFTYFDHKFMLTLEIHYAFSGFLLINDQFVDPSLHLLLLIFEVFI